MKIKFTKLPTNDDTIKVSLDGGQSFTDYNVADVHESGIPLADSQDYEKNQIQAPANVLKNLNVVSSVKVDGEDGGESTNEHSFIMDTDTYGFNFPRCVTGIIIPNGMTLISGVEGESLFYGYPNLQTIVIPESVTVIGPDAFRGCSSLTSITIPSSVTKIGDGVFSSCTGLTSITIPDSVTSIGKNAFNGCKGLTSVTIPSSVTSIGSYAFRNCTSLKTINYTGNEEQWNAISKGTDWNYETSLNVIYNYKPE